MQTFRFFTLNFLVSFSLFVFACGGGGGDSSDSGTIAMSVTDAKPLLPENVTNLFVEFSEAWVHKSGEGWIQLTLVESPYTIDLLQFQDSNTTELVLPTELDSGKYTQVRIVVSSATMVFDNGGTPDELTIDVPSENLKTDKNFIVDVTGGSAMDITIHFDLSMSVVASGPDSNPTYKLKPVLHLFDDPFQAATIEGVIDNSSFDASENATIIVISESNGEEYTRVVVPTSATPETPETTEFSIFWIVPDQSYTVQIDIDEDGTPDCSESVEADDLSEGAVFELNGGNPIETGNGICSLVN
jgi:hypothetical protein